MQLNRVVDRAIWIVQQEGTVNYAAFISWEASYTGNTGNLSHRRTGLLKWKLVRSTERYAYYRSQPEGTSVGDDPGGPGEIELVE